MKIRLTKDLPVSEIQECLKGNIYEVLNMGKVRNSPVIFISHCGDEVTAFSHEYEIVEESS